VKKRSATRDRTDGYVYCLYDTVQGICRIGITGREDDSRIKTQIGYLPNPVEYKKYYTYYKLDVEKFLHQKFKPFKFNGDWFKVKPEEVEKEIKVLLERQKKPFEKGKIDFFQYLNLKEMRVIIAGGRDFQHYKLMKYKMIEILKNITTPITIIQGGAEGADKLAITFAKERGYKMKQYDAEWDNLLAPGAIIKNNSFGKPYNAKAGIDRNEKMAKNADALVAFWDGKSPGTKSMIDIAERHKLKIRVIKY
jgi:hypothetical protein